ncbi:MAG: TonB-dependent receptor [Pseudomonadota bacterium]|nr:TonB-dependent receptor [Pseudomonadota bacterium]
MKNSNRIVAASAVSIIVVSANVHAQDDDDAHHEIDQVIVTADPLSRTVEELAQPTTILRGDELIKKQSTSIGETLSQEPGLSSTYFGPVSSRPVIRGQYGERVRVLVNGLDSLDASALSEDHQATVESLLADRIEILRGPATLLYGSGAAGGLVNVVDTRFVKQPLDKPFSGGVALGADTAVGNRDAAVRTQFGNGPIAISADFFTRSTDNIEIPGFAESAALMAVEEEEGHEEEEESHEEEEAFGVVENTDSRSDGGAVGVSFIGGRAFLGVCFRGFNSKYGIPGHHHEEGHHEEEEEENVRIDLEQRRVDLIGEYDVDGGFLSAIRYRAALNDYKHTEFEGEEIGTVFDVQGMDSRLELRHAEMGGFEGAFGLQYKQVDFNAIGDEAFVPASDTTRTSLFVYEEFRVNDGWILQGSARFEDQSISGASLGEQYDGSAFGASVGAVWRPVGDIRVSANLALTERHPTTAELYADGPHIAAQRYERGSVTLGNGILDLEKSTNLDLTVHGDSGEIEWSITGFVNSADNYILLMSTALELDEMPVFDYGQADVGFTGIEAQALIELLDRDDSHVHLSIFTDYVNAEQDVSGAYLPRIPPSRFGFGLHGGWNQFDASLEATFAADQDDVAANELPTEGYALLNLSLSYTFADPDLYVFVRGSNLLDEEIRQHTSPLKDLIPLPGRSIHVGLRYEF